MVKFSQSFTYLNSTVGEVPISSNIFSFSNTGAGLDLVNLDYYYLVTEHHPNVVLKFSYLKDTDGVDTLNISGVDGVK